MWRGYEFSIDAGATEAVGIPSRDSRQETSSSVGILFRHYADVVVSFLANVITPKEEDY